MATELESLKDAKRTESTKNWRLEGMRVNYHPGLGLMQMEKFITLTLNTSYMMYGPIGSFSSMHVEGGAYGSSNVITNKKGQKFWLCLNLPSTRLLMKELSKLGLQTNKRPYGREGKKCGKGRPCEVRACEKSGLHGPGFFITPEFLREHSISFFNLVQNAGDLVFTFPGVVHQIVNTRSTVC